LRDGRAAVDVRVDLPRPRDRGDAEFARLRRLFLAELGVDHEQSTT